MEYCIFKNSGCIISSPSPRVCSKSDENWCTMANVLREKREKGEINMARNGERFEAVCPECLAVKTGGVWRGIMLTDGEKERIMKNLPVDVCPECLDGMKPLEKRCILFELGI